MTQAYTLYGTNPSPYSRKLRAILCYRRLPYIWRVGTAGTLPEIAHVKPRLIPVLRLPGSSEYRVDSTPLAYLLEERHPGERSIIPPDPGAAFVSHLIEDFADEWLTKMMFHFRWTQEETARWAADWIVHDAMPSLSAQAHAQAAQMFYTRQRGRCALVGSTPENAPVLEASYGRLLELLGPLISGDRFLFGSRPALADFGLYGQLCQLTIDPWPQSLCRARAPAVEAWVQTLNDGSGIDGEWDSGPAADLRSGLLEMIGQEYLPFLQANADAVMAGQEEFQVIIRGLPYSQAVFAYQSKCLAETRRRWADLSESAQSDLHAALEHSGCLDYMR